MGAVIFARYNNIGEALADQSCLTAGGFSVDFENYFHGINDYFSLLAFGGIMLMLPEHEYVEAKEFLKDMKRHPLEDEDPIPVKKYGYWVRATLAMPALCLPVYFLYPEVLFLLLIVQTVYYVWLGETIWITFLTIPILVVLILLHAKYIALPKLRRTNTV